jgi:hypothetical protein
VTLVVEGDWVRGVNDDLVNEQARKLRAQFLDRAEPEGEDDGIGAGERVSYRCGACERSDLVRERFRARFILRGQDDGLATGDQAPGEGTPDVADADDCGGQGDPFPTCDLMAGIVASAAGQSIPTTRGP